jgi:hypothetical protein
MFGSVMLEVGIGLALVFTLMALIASALTELIAKWLGLRAKTLDSALKRMLGQTLRQKLKDHALIQSLTTDDQPTYIPPLAFARAAVDVLRQHGPTVPQNEKPALETLTRMLTRQPENPLKFLTDASLDQLKDLEEDVRVWFDSSMQSWTLKFRREAQQRAAWVSFALAIFLNVDAIRISTELYQNSSVRAVVMATAQTVVVQAPGSNEPDPNKQYKALSETLASLQLPIGWPQQITTPLLLESIPARMPGWILTALAVAPGAAFWFNLLRRLVDWRTMITPTQTKPELQSAASG